MTAADQKVLVIYHVFCQQDDCITNSRFYRCPTGWIIVIVYCSFNINKTGIFCLLPGQLHLVFANVFDTPAFNPSNHLIPAIVSFMFQRVQNTI